MIEQKEKDIQTDAIEGLDTSKVDAIPSINFNRKFRKALLKQSGYIKLKNRLGYKDWFENVKNNIQNGKQLHVSNTEEVIKRSIERTERTNESTAGFLLERGYTEQQASDIIENNIEIQERISKKKLKR